MKKICIALLIPFAIQAQQPEIRRSGGAGGAGTPGGNTTEFQYNNGGSFDGASGIVIGTGETNILISGAVNVWGLTISNQLLINGAGNAAFNGSGGVSINTGLLTVNSSIMNAGNLDNLGTLKVIQLSTFGAGVVITNGATNYGVYQGVGTNNGAFRANGTNTGFAEFTTIASGVSNIYVFSAQALPSVGQVLGVHSISSANGSNTITITNLTVTSSPAGATTQVQYNNASSMDGASGVVIPASNGETNLMIYGLTSTFNLVASNSFQGLGTGLNGIDALIVTNTLTVGVGKSASNAWAGGTIYVDNNAYTNKIGDAVLTNSALLLVKGFTLTNLYDQVEVWTSGSSQQAVATTNNIKWLYGATVILDTGLQGSSNTAWRAQTTITRLTTTSQKIAHTLWWGGNTYQLTNVILNSAENNANDITFQVQLASRKPGGITNDFLHAKYWPAPR